MRCQSIRGIKDNSHNQYKEDLSCPLKCLNSIDTQEHVLFLSRFDSPPYRRTETKVSISQIPGYIWDFGPADQHCWDIPDPAEDQREAAGQPGAGLPGQ